MVMFTDMQTDKLASQVSRAALLENVTRPSAALLEEFAANIVL